MEQKVLIASANSGIGLFTMICRGFTMILGIESKNYLKKQNKVLNQAKERLNEELASLGADYELSDMRVTWQGGLTVTVSALAVRGGGRVAMVASAPAKQCPSCGAPIDDDMDFCGECGAKLK